MVSIKWWLQQVKSTLCRVSVCQSVWRYCWQKRDINQAKDQMVVSTSNISTMKKNQFVSPTCCQSVITGDKCLFTTAINRLLTREIKDIFSISINCTYWTYAYFWPRSYKHLVQDSLNSIWAVRKKLYRKVRAEKNVAIC